VAGLEWSRSLVVGRGHETWGSYVSLVPGRSSLTGRLVSLPASEAGGRHTFTSWVGQQKLLQRIVAASVVILGGKLFMPGEISTAGPNVIELRAQEPCECHLPPGQRKYEQDPSDPICVPCWARFCLESIDQFLEQPDAIERNTIDWANRTYYCGNCGCPRSINEHCEAEKCQQCGDDETYLEGEVA